jgi:DNA-binding response OmpR family regulator
MAKENTKEELVEFLSIGTRILTKDVMDQFIRSLGNNRTHYAATVESARRVFQESSIDFIITEFDVGESNVFHFIREIKTKHKEYVFVVLASEESNSAQKSIAQELEVDAILVKPFAASDLKVQIDAYNQKISDKNNPDLLIFQADREFREKNHQVADRMYLNLLKAFPENVRVMYRAGLHFLRKPDVESAQKYFYKALELDPEFVPAMNALGVCALKKKEFKMAHSMLTQAQAASPLNPDRPLNLCRLFMEWGTDLLKSGLRQDADNVMMQFELGRYLIMQRDYAGAVNILRKAKLPDEHPNAKEAQALIQLAMKVASIK